MSWYLLKTLAKPVPKNSVNSEQNDVQNPVSNLNRVKIENPSITIFGQININSIRNKFDLLMNIVKNVIDTFMISETKIDKSFPIS